MARIPSDRKIKDDLRAISDPMKAVREFADQQRKIKDDLKAIVEPTNAVREFVDQQRKIKDDLKAIVEPTNAVREFVDQQRKFKDDLKAISDPMKAVREFADQQRSFIGPLLQMHIQSSNARQNAVGDTLLHEQETQLTSATTLGLLVKQARLRRSLTQQQFADLAGVGRRFLSELENGKTSLEFNKVIQVANAAGIDLFARSRS